MICCYCHDEEIDIQASGTCVECQNPACSRPSGRPDSRFHGERCRQTSCNKFVCEFDVHDHLGGMPTVVSKAIPTCFPYLTVGVSFDTLVAAETSLGHREDAPLPVSANRVFTRATNLLEPVQRNHATGQNESVEAYAQNKDAASRWPFRMRSEFFDVVRVARLCILAGASLVRAWSVFPKGETPRFRRAAPDADRPGLVSESLEDRMQLFVEDGAGKLDRNPPDAFDHLSDRLAYFLRDVRDRFPETLQQPSEVTFSIRPQYLKYRPNPMVDVLDKPLEGWVVV
jgi:hypothetical protein